MTEPASTVSQAALFGGTTTMIDFAMWSPGETLQKAIENRMRDIGGYALLEKRSVKNRGGLTGTQLRFGRDESKAPHLYIITIFTTDERVYLLEAGGVKDEMKRLVEQIDWSVSNFLQK